MPEGYINVIMGHLAMETFWEQTLHQNSMLILTLALQNLERVTMTNVPYQISRLKLNGENGHHHEEVAPTPAATTPPAAH
jgi:hypothetical protein